jgi:hypothetical protein
LLEDTSEFIAVDVDTAWNELKDADRPAVERYLDDIWREGTDGDVEQRIKELFIEEFHNMVERYGEGYAGWMGREIHSAVDDATTHATGAVNVEGALRRLRQKFPLVATLDPATLGGVNPDMLARQLESLIPRSREEGNNLRLFAQELQTIVPFIPGATPDVFLMQFRENVQALMEEMEPEARENAFAQLLTGVQASLQPVYAGQGFTEEQGEHFQAEVDGAWMDALQLAGQRGDDELLEGLERLLDRTFDRWRGLIGVDLLNRYGRELTLNAMDREWVDYLTAMEEMRQGIYLQGIAQRDPLVAYKTQAFRMFEELLEAIDRTTVQSFFNNLPRYVAQVQQQEIAGQAARARDIKVGPNEPCPCGSGKKFKKCHGAPNRAAAASVPRAVAAIAAPASGDGASGQNAPAAPKLTQQQRQKQSQDGQRRKSKGRPVPSRRS